MKAKELSTVNEPGAGHFKPDKIFAHKDRVEEWLKTGRSSPVTMELDMTNVCNQKCPHCFGYYPERDQARLCPEAAARLVREAASAGVRGLTFTGGGDPTVNPATLETVRLARSLGLDVGFITNAQKLGLELARVLIDSCVWIRVSIDAATPEVFRKTHGMGPEQFQRVLESVRMLVRIKKEQASKATIGIGFLTSETTKKDIEPFAELGKSLGVDYAQYRPLLRRHGEEEIDYADPEILDAMLRARSRWSDDFYKVVCSEHKYQLIASGSIKRSYGRCYGQHFATVVSADQKMYVCCHMRGVEKYQIGDLSKNSISEIWNSEERQRVADSVDFNDCPPLCRCDSFNEILWDLKDGERSLSDAPQGGTWEHENFI